MGRSKTLIFIPQPPKIKATGGRIVQSSVDKTSMAYPADEFIIRPKQGGAEVKSGLILAKNKEKMSPAVANGYGVSKDDSKIIWLSVSEVAKLGGLSTKTVRRAIESGQIKFKVINNRYQINMTTAIRFFLSSQKLKNKLNQEGIGQWISEWKM